VSTELIRWSESSYGSLLGHVGTHEEWLFQIWRHEHGHEWVLGAQIPGWDRQDGRPEPDDLKPVAETWLREFVTSLGAVFPDAAEPAGTPDWVCDCEDWPVGHIHTPRGIQPVEDEPADTEGSR
jgi:hypothetical protein